MRRGLRAGAAARYDERMSRILVGTSGWSYKHWQGPFYPPDLAHGEWLRYYASRLASVEINASFYRLPSADTLREWQRQVPSGFVFAFKASRYLTHMKKLRPAPEALGRLFGCAEVLGPQLGPILFQLPPRWRANPARLGEFLDALPKGHRYAFELRDESWWCDAVYEILARHDVATVWFDMEKRRSPLVDTAPFRYVRWHGPGAHAYTGRYGRNRLRTVARQAREWCRNGQDTYVYLDNDEGGHAPADALALQDMLDD